MKKERILTKNVKIECLGEGWCFKDRDAYENKWDEVCYIPEYAMEDEYIEPSNMYTHNDLLELCKDCEATRDNYSDECDYMFGELEWCCPETFLDEIDY